MPEPTSSASVTSIDFSVWFYFRLFSYDRRAHSLLYLFSNMLALVPEGEQPRSRIVGPKLSYMDERIAAIDLVISKLVRGSSLLCPGPSLSPQCLTLVTPPRENNFKS